MTQELSLEAAHQQRSELQYAKYKSDGRYSKKATTFKDATHIYLGEIGFRALLTEEEQYFSRLALKGDESARHRLIESNLRLVVKIARRYVNRGLTLLDLIEEGNLGLIRAVDKFDPEKGVGLKSLQDPIDTTNAQGRLVFNIFASLAEFERDLMIERTQAGLSAARARGCTGGRPKGLNESAKKKPLLQKLFM